MRGRTDFADALGRELRHAIRALLRARTFTVITAFTLALGLGAATAMFTILDAVVLRPLPYPHGDRLVAVSSPVPGIKAAPVWGIARHEMFYFKQQSRTLEDLGVYNATVGTVAAGGGPQEAERAPVALVSASLLNVLGIVPERGRLLNADDNLKAKDQLGVVLLTHGFWERRYGGDPSIIGKQIYFEGYPTTVVGILPASAQLPDLKIDLWLPLYTNPAAPALNNHTYRAIGRLPPGVSVDDARRELTALTARFGEAFPNVYTPTMLKRTGFTTLVTSLRDDVVGSLVTKALWILFGAVSVVLLIAAANVANLFVVRVAVRSFVVRQSLVLAGIGAAIGLAAALATMRVLGALLFGVSPTDPAVLASATVLLLLLAAAASYAPARRASNVDPVEALRM
jgi:putative ABC transport system permease protein